MIGEAVIARSISAASIEDSHGNQWQYHSRSDRHSKIACWAVMFDFLRTCELLREHVRSGKVGFGINHELRDFKQNRKKNLDLVLSKGAATGAAALTFTEYGIKMGIKLTSDEAAELTALPALRAGAVSTVLVALEAKACMTEHVKAQPRLFDELASSFQTVHGDTNSAIAAAFVMINSADNFISADRNRKKVRTGKFVVNTHKQPAAALVTLAKVLQLPRRSNEQERGFDALGITMVQCRNDGSTVTVDTRMNAAVDGIVTYTELIQRLAHLYATKFGSI
jgi:hypothetical protein